ncbi:MAG: alpha/beta hydrolase [Pseudolysinimonas sp.]
MTPTQTAQEPAVLDFKEATVDADGFTVRYLTAGEGEPLLVLHGAGGLETQSSGMGRGKFMLADGFRAFFIEVPGFGDQPNDRTADSEVMAGTVLAVADALGLDTFALLGTSMGAVIASWVATTAPERVTRLVLEAPAFFRGHADPSSLSPDEFIKAFHAHPERKQLSPPDPDYAARTWPLVMKLVGPAHDEKLAAALAEISIPTLVLIGQDDGIVQIETGRFLRSIMHSCTNAIVYDAAHDVSGDRPEAFHAVVSDFLRRGSLFVVQERSTLLYP